RGPGSIFRKTRPPIGYHSGASVTAWPTTWRSRQHSDRRLSRLYDVLPPWRYIRSIASRALSAACVAARRQRARCSSVVASPAATVFQMSVTIAVRYPRPAFSIVSAPPLALLAASAERPAPGDPVTAIDRHGPSATLHGGASDRGVPVSIEFLDAVFRQTKRDELRDVVVADVPADRAGALCQYFDDAE